MNQIMFNKNLFGMMMNVRGMDYEKAKITNAKRSRYVN